MAAKKQPKNDKKLPKMARKNPHVSIERAVFLWEISRKFGIGCKILTWNEKKPTTSIMQKAREIS